MDMYARPEERRVTMCMGLNGFLMSSHGCEGIVRELDL